MGRIADIVAGMRGARLSEIVAAIAEMEAETPAARQGTPRAALLTVLDPEHADAVLEHRQRIRKPMTERAAKLLAGQLAKCPDANAAADAMLLNGWQGVKPEWMERQNDNGNRANPARSNSPHQKLMRGFGV